MEPRSKRTYRLSTRAQARVREMAGEYGVGGSQDAVVEIAVDRLYREVEAAAEARRWAAAAEDPAFTGEVEELAREFAELEAWPA
jgi:hypothetical protein